MKVQFTIPGEPVAKARARVVWNKHLKRVMAFTPSKTTSYEEVVASVARGYFRVPLVGPVVLTIRLYRRIPQSLSKQLRRQAENGEIRPITKPDCSNYQKAVEDALNKIAYKDDSQIVSVHVEKFYSEIPRAEIAVATLKEKL